MRTLTLTTPYMTGDDVREAQTLLAVNVFEQDFAPGAADGEFGPETARACKRAKFWLGYTSSAQTPICGDRLVAYLSGKKALPPDYASRRKERHPKPNAPALRERAFAEAMRHPNTLEEPIDSNNVFFSRWYAGVRSPRWSSASPGPPWCAMFITYCYVAAGSKAFSRGARYAYVPYVLADAHAGRNNLALTKNPQRGDLVIFDWTSDGTPDHIGLFDTWASTTTITTVEGNTSPGDQGSQSNGGGVYQRTRPASLVAGFVHVGQ